MHCMDFYKQLWVPRWKRIHTHTKQSSTLLAYFPFQLHSCLKILSQQLHHALHCPIPAGYVCVCGTFKWSIGEKKHQKCVCAWLCMCKRMKERDENKEVRKGWVKGMDYIRPVSAPLSTCSVSHVRGLVNRSTTWLLCQSSKVAVALWKN